MVFHGIVVDEWSVEQLRQELAVAYAEMYEEFTGQIPPNLPQGSVWPRLMPRSPLPGQSLKAEIHSAASSANSATSSVTNAVTDTTIHPAVNSASNSASSEAATLEFWLQHLQGAPLLLELPSDRPRPSQPRFQRCGVTFQWEPDLRQSLLKLSQQEACTLENTLLAIFLVFLHRYSDQPDLVIGYPQDQWSQWYPEEGGSSGDRDRRSNQEKTSVLRPVGPGTEIVALRSQIQAFSLDSEQNLSFQQFLHQIIQIYTQITTSPTFPLESLLQQFQISPSTSYTPWYQVLFRFGPQQDPALLGYNLPLGYESPIHADSLSDAQSSPDSQIIAPLWPCFLHHSPFDLTLSLWDSGTALQGFLDYNPDLFDAETISALLAQFQTLTRHLTAQPQTPVSQAPLLSPDQLSQWLRQWNPIATSYSPGSVVDLIAAQAQRSPQALAVIATSGGPQRDVEQAESGVKSTNQQVELTYGELMAQSEQIAGFLRQRGIGPGQRVGLALGRSVQLVTAVLGVLRSGAAYVPLDPSYPADRLQFMATDADLSLILTDEAESQEQEAKATQVDWQGIPSLSLTRLSLTNPAQPDPDPQKSGLEALNPDDLSFSGLNPSPKATDLAYLIYTSGSTGKPKGVAIAHGSLVNFLESMQDYLQLAPQDTWLALTTLSFDIAALELLLPLIVGATVAIAPQASQRDAFLLAQLIEQFQATVIQATPTTWQLLRLAQWQGWAEDSATASKPQSQAVSSRSPFKPQLLCGGEALTPTIARFLLTAAGPQGKVWNLYGPTETTIWSLIQPISADLLHTYDRAPALPIGFPLANTQVYILNSAQKPCLAGQPGEIYLGGAGLAQGYWQRPELTAERFPGLAVDPTQPQPQRLYRTGDRGRWHREGRLEFLGRVDYQVKLRGHRLELGEVEQALEQHPQIDLAVVRLWEPPVVSNPALVGYGVALEAENPPTVQDLRQFLRRSLPDYMIPSAFMLLPDLPRTANGKVDRRALPLPERFSPESRVSRSSPGADKTPDSAVSISRLSLKSPAAKILSSTWQRYLKVESLTPESHFLDLGGNSLLAMEIAVALSPHFPHLRLRHLFQYPTLGQLAQFLDTDASATQAATQSATQAAWLSAAVLNRGNLPLPLFFVNAIGQFRQFTKFINPQQTVYGLNIFDLDLAQSLFINPQQTVYGLNIFDLDLAQSLGSAPSQPSAAPSLTLATFAQALVQQVQTLQPQGPYALGAYCDDTCVIWEMAQQLRKQGEEVVFLGFIDTIWQPKASDFGLLANLQTARIYGLDYLRYRLQRTHQPAPPPDAPALDRWLYDQFMAATDRYSPQPYPGPVTLFPSKEYRLKSNALAQFVQGSLKTVLIESYHHNMFQLPYVARFGQQFQSQLDLARSQAYPNSEP
ncbi:MAG: amino acid adenylation domain-containing protein [Prochlorothrix sp.]